MPCDPLRLVGQRQSNHCRGEGERHEHARLDGEDPERLPAQVPGQEMWIDRGQARELQSNRGARAEQQGEPGEPFRSPPSVYEPCPAESQQRSARAEAEQSDAYDHGRNVLTEAQGELAHQRQLEADHGGGEKRKGRTDKPRSQPRNRTGQQLGLLQAFLG